MSDARELDLRLVPAAIAAWTIAGVTITVPPLAVPSALVAALATAGALVYGVRRPSNRETAAAVALVLCVVALIATVVAVRSSHRVPEAVAQAAEAHTRVEVEATVTAMPKSGGNSIRVRAQLQRIDAQAVDAPVLLFMPVDASTPPSIGATIKARATLQLVPPGDRIVALVFAREPPETIAPPHPLLALGDQVRSKFLAAAAPLPAPGNMLVPGLAVGDERLVSSALEEDMRAASLTHLTAVSGSNIALIVAGVIALGRFAAWPRLVRISVAMLALTLFVLLVTPQGSVIRAAAMGLLVLAVDAAARPTSGVPVLALAIIVLLTLDPWLARDYGFALSAAATAGLLLGTRPTTRLLERWLPTPIALMLAVPLVAQLACQPILILLEPELPTYGILANLLAAPAAPIATVAGLIGGLAGVVVPPLGTLLLRVAWLPAQWIGLVAHAVAQFPFAVLPWVPGWAGALLLILVIAAIVLVVNPRAGSGGLGVVRRIAALALSIATVIVVLVAAIQFATLRRDLPSNWRLAVCDVGQGDALLLQADGRIILVDTGEAIEPLITCLERFGVDSIDLLIVSHFDRDHIGALQELAVPIGEAWMPDTEQARTEPDAIRLMASGATVRFVAAGDRMRFGDLELVALWPQRRGSAPSRAEDNDGSLVVLARPNDGCREACYSTLLLGDAGERIQQRIARTYPSLRADVLKVSHHGSADQSAEFTQQLSGKLAVISVGADNTYGHPTDAALDALRQAGTPWLRTDERGSFAVYEAAGAMQIWAAEGT